MSSPSPPNDTAPPNERLFLLRWGLFALVGLLGWLLWSGRLTLFNNVPPQVQAGETALKAGNMGKAVQQFDAAIKARPADPNVYSRISQVCKEQKNGDLAVHYTEQAVAACKDAPRTVRAELYLQLSMYYAEVETAPHQEKAVGAAQHALELAPDEPLMLNGYGYVLADNDRKLDEAVALLRRALELLRKQPNVPQTRLMVAITEDSYGWALYKQGNYPAAVSAISQALTDLSNSLTEETKTEGEDFKVLYYHLGAASHKAARLQEARNALMVALRYDPSYAPAKAELESLPPPAASSSENRSGAGAANTSGAGPGGEAKPSVSSGSHP